MRVNPTGRSEYHDGNEVGRYGQDISANQQYFCWYHDGVRGFDEPAWAMDTKVESKISFQVHRILVADANHGVFAIDREEFRNHVTHLNGRKQYIARATDDYVTPITADPSGVLRGNLWVESGNQIDEGYHQKANH